ncbi:hypothetical protein MTBUT4_100093 [Magnetospirillum sp. UT-4]|nr:hypothetical protein MTBUT4_100093 [Magnetospirillum sp. UT-4]
MAGEGVGAQAIRLDIAAAGLADAGGGGAAHARQHRLKGHFIESLDPLRCAIDIVHNPSLPQDVVGINYYNVRRPRKMKSSLCSFRYLLRGLGKRGTVVGQGGSRRRSPCGCICAPGPRWRPISPARMRSSCPSARPSSTVPPA